MEDENNRLQFIDENFSDLNCCKVTSQTLNMVQCLVYYAQKTNKLNRITKTFSNQLFNLLRSKLSTLVNKFPGVKGRQSGKSISWT